MTTDNYSDYDDYDISTTAQTEDEGLLCQLELHPTGTLVQTYVHSFIFVLGLLGNLLVMVTYACYKKRRTMTDLFLLNVAVADLLFIAALPLTVYNEHHGWLMAGDGACKLAEGVYSVNLYAGMLLLACVGGDRYMAIVQARRFFGARTRLIPGRLVCGAVWVLAVALSLPTVIYMTHLEEVDPDTKRVSASCHMSFSSNATAKHMKVLVPALQVAVGFLLPLALMVFCYGSVLRCLLRAQASNQKRKAVRVVLAVVAVFVACHLPYNAALMSHTLGLLKPRSCTGEVRKRNVLAVTRSVAYLHCCLNAFLYAFVGVKFRYHFKKILRDMWCIMGKRFVQPSRSSVNAMTTVSVLGSRSASVSNNVPTFSA